MQKLKRRWGITSNLQLLVIFIVFAITGTTAARCAAPLTAWLGVTAGSTPGWVYWPLQILLILPLYQVLLLFIGTIFGQFHFFWAFEKRMLSRCGVPLSANRSAKPSTTAYPRLGDRAETTERQRVPTAAEQLAD